MTVYDLCIKLGKILPLSIKVSLHHSGILNTVRRHNRDVSIDIQAVHSSLMDEIETIKRKSEKAIGSIQKAIDLIESTANIA